MDHVNKKIIKKRFTWLEPARQGIIRAIGDPVIHEKMSILPTVDPIRLILKLRLTRKIGKATREPLRTYLRCWAEMEGCELPIININDNCIQAEVLIQHRHWERDAHGRFKGGRRFERRSR
jgi:hypothetical protein